MNELIRRLRWLLPVLLLVVAVPVASAQRATKESRATKEAKPSAPVDLNTASQKDLEALPGVGAATARKIIDGRPYTSVADLSRAGVSKSTIDKISPMVTVSAPAARAPRSSTRGTPSAKEPSGPVDLNTASEKDLEALPGVGPATAKKIIAGRPYSSVADLSKAGVPKSTVDKISAMVTVSSSAPSETRAPRAPRAPSAPAAPPASAGTPPTSMPSPTSAPPASSPRTSSPSTPRQSAPATPSAQGEQPPQPGMVWVNLDTKVYHKEGDRWYGKTKHGKWMTEQEAIAAGYRAAKK